MEKFDYVPSVSDTLGLGNRQRGDGCPGALTMHQAADGFIGRIRIAGGRASSAHLAALAQLAEEHGDGDIHVTTRGNVQIRGISEREAFSSAVCELGLVPSSAHDKIRNIIASPLAPALDQLVARLDEGLLASTEVTGLSGRTLFGLDAGDGAITANHPDFGIQIHSETEAIVVLGGVPTVLSALIDATPQILVAAAEQWQRIRGDHWRVQENPELRDELLRHLETLPEVSRTSTTLEVAQRAKADEAPIGWLERSDGLVDLGASLPFGVLSARVARMLAATDKPVRITPWAGVVVCELHEDEAEAVAKVLAPQGLVFDRRSPWLRVTACTGLPGCTKSRSDVRGDALSAIRTHALPDPTTADAVHFSGCERRCGHPLHNYWDYLAEGDGDYEVSVASGTPATARTF
ncbi:ferredoxin-nitrite reductase [Corynebacterium ciconiae DSM 44920]|uniref:precorrin-3B synthase n=1 Tax=Corynebacterium ciconiae TaxID=227319 RepID=UPI00036FEA40|nr:precorrin-3B synthase [Corynebacterium ciconiae]WKD61167.1 ferredoxin-nitrite reductase [Corynebacterium ciconiae DSM 44920]